MQVLTSPATAAAVVATIVDTPRTPSPPMAFIKHQHKKPSHHLLIREIKRLRQENTCLRSSVTVLQTDLRNESESRKATDETHKKIYDDILDRNNKLELDLMDKEDEIELLKQKVDQLERKLIDHQLSKKDDDDESNQFSLHLHRNSNVFGCYDVDDIIGDHHHHHNQNDMFCQPSAHESALPDLNSNENNRFLMNNNSDDDDDNDNEGTDKTSTVGSSSLLPVQRRDDDDEEEEEEEDQEEEEEKEQFDELVPSYIHQAIVSKLSSARVRLELDDLILKYEASGEIIFRALGKSFIDWIGSVLKQQEDNENLSKLFMTKIQTGIAGFWQEILCYFAHDYEGQYTLLNVIEDIINDKQQVDNNTTTATVKKTKNTSSSPSSSSSCWRKIIADHFDHLVLMLYKHHIVDDEAVVSWWKTPLHNNSIGKQIRNMTLRFVEWIEDSEEEDDSEEDDDEDDDSDSEEDDSDCGSEEEEEEEEEDSEEEDVDVDFTHFQHGSEEGGHVEFDDSDMTMSPPHTDDPSTSGDDTDNGYEHQQQQAMLDNHSLHTMLNELLVDNEYCICQFNNDVNDDKIRNAANTTTASGLGSFDNQLQDKKQQQQQPQQQLTECLCDLNSITVPVTEKKKKTVRIAM